MTAPGLMRGIPARLAVVACIATALLLTPAIPTRASTSAPHSAWVNVSVATLWTSPSAPRPVDAPALRVPADVRGWLAHMNTAARRDLAGRVETQALYGEKLLVIGSASHGWLHVLAVAQRTSRDSRGYPGWVPAAQTTTHQPVATTDVATVLKPTTWLVNANGSKSVEISFASRLPVRRTEGSWVVVYTPTGGTHRVALSAVSVRSANAGALPRTVTGVIATARTLVGIPYLWGGRSGFAIDCSGLTQLVYRLHAVTLPRDTGDQANAGKAVSVTHRAAGDLLLYGGSSMTHVALESTASRMIEAPSSGLKVREVSVRAPRVVRRYL
jgi:gamma-D-glutamyl-L-lysine dipeptidyl-peptidase